MEKDVVYWSLRKKNLKLIIVVFLFYIFLQILYRIISYEVTSFYVVSTLLCIAVLVWLFFMSYSVKMDSIYQQLVYFVLWSIVLIFTLVSFVNKLVYEDIIVLSMLIMINFHSIFNLRVLKRFLVLYFSALMVMIFLFDTNSHNEITLLFICIFLSLAYYLTGKYEVELSDAYAKISEQQSSLLSNANEAFVLHEIVRIKKDGLPELRLIEANEAFEEMIGKKKGIILGKNSRDIIPFHEKFWSDIIEEVVINRKNVKKIECSLDLDRYFEVRVYLVEKNKLAMLILDITKKIQYENDLKRAVIEVERVNKSKNQFLKDVNHRLRTPLNGMMGMMQLIDLKELSKDNLELFEAMVLEMKHSRNILNQISEYVNVSDMKHVLQKGSLEEDIKDVISEIRKNDQERIHLTFNDNIVGHSYYEKDVLKRIVGKLLRNALRFSSDSIVEISVSQKEDNSNIHVYNIDIIDKGEGVPLEKQEFIFNELYHHDFVHIYKADHHLSLPLCKQLAINSGGDLNLESQPGRGSKFTLIIPVKQRMIEPEI